VDVGLGLLEKRGQRYRVGDFEFVEDIGELGVFRRSYGA
jgi:hypothetical protein